MNRRLHELALKKQRLQFQSAQLRDRWIAQAHGVRPLLAGIDRVGRGVQWVQRHPTAVLAVGIALLVARPRTALRWTRRAFVAWQAWHKGRSWLSPR